MPIALQSYSITDGIVQRYRSLLRGGYRGLLITLRKPVHSEFYEARRWRIFPFVG